MDIITCLIYLFPQDAGWGDEANFISQVLRQERHCSVAFYKLFYLSNQIKISVYFPLPWKTGRNVEGEENGKWNET